MKIYRVVPNGFLAGKRLDTNNKVSSEALYYEMGYTPFSDKIVDHVFNTLGCENLHGKYFYLFAEDAIREGNNLIRSYHELWNQTCSMLEYDVPVDMVMKHIGYGDYTYDIFTIHLMEAFIEKDDFGSNAISSNEIDENEKLNHLVFF